MKTFRFLGTVSGMSRCWSKKDREFCSFFEGISNRILAFSGDFPEMTFMSDLAKGTRSVASFAPRPQRTARLGEFRRVKRLIKPKKQMNHSMKTKSELGSGAGSGEGRRGEARAGASLITSRSMRRLGRKEKGGRMVGERPASRHNPTRS
jgi:hypothetical protein